MKLNSKDIDIYMNILIEALILEVSSQIFYVQKIEKIATNIYICACAVVDSTAISDV